MNASTVVSRLLEDEEVDPKEFVMDQPSEWIVKTTWPDEGVYYWAGWSSRVAWVRGKKLARGFATKEEAIGVMQHVQRHFTDADNFAVEPRVARPGKKPDLSP